MQRAAAKHRAERAGVLLLPQLKHNGIDAGRHLDKLQPQFGAERTDRRWVQSGQRRIEENRHDRKGLWVKPAQSVQRTEQRERILPA